MSTARAEEQGGGRTPGSGRTTAILVLGDGGWGTAIALTLARAGHDVRLWGYDPGYTAEMARSRRNPRFLPGVAIPDGISISSDAGALAFGAEVIFSVIPTQFLRATLARIGAELPAGALHVSASKGIEQESLVLPSRIVEDVLGAGGVAVLSGPSHAEEVSRGLPTTVVAAARDPEASLRVQRLFARTRLRVYTNPDPVGVELGGAVKNVIAIAAGISDGLGFGDNSRAAIITRGLVEITRLGLSLGARRETFSGLSGIGDLITTCTSSHSRNRDVGCRIGRGERLEEILASTQTVAEGVATTRSVHELARRGGVEMPITREVFAVLYEGKPPQQAVESLMARHPRGEMEDLV